MENIDDKNETNNTNSNNWQSINRPHSGRVIAGSILIVIGCVFMARELGMWLPDWLFTWQMLLIVIGLYTGAKHNFTRGGWFVPVIIGSIFLLDDIFPDIIIRPMIWPMIIIFIGIVMIVRPRRNNYWKDWKNSGRGWNKCEQHNYYHMNETTGDDRLHSVSIFGGLKKNIISKDFKGGDVTCIFGGAEINLSQADINGKVVLEVTQVFGGTKLIVPANWEVQSEMMAILGGIEDKRPVQRELLSEQKVLVIRGTSVFGGIDIKSY